VIAGTRRGLEAAERTLSGAKVTGLRSALEAAIRAWGAGLHASGEEAVEPPEEAVLKQYIGSRLDDYTVEAALLDRESAASHTAFMDIPQSDLDAVLTKFR
jgi:hypothetical protein